MVTFWTVSKILFTSWKFLHGRYGYTSAFIITSAVFTVIVYLKEKRIIRVMFLIDACCYVGNYITTRINYKPDTYDPIYFDIYNPFEDLLILIDEIFMVL